MVRVMVEPFAQRLRRLAEERGTSVNRVLHDAWDTEVRGTSPDFARKVMSGSRALTPTLIIAVAGALDVPPEEFPEYRLARAREDLDEELQGLERALEALERYTPATPEQRFAARTAKEAQRSRQRRARGAAGPRAAGGRGGGT